MDTAATSALIETPLAAFHRAAGVRMGTWFGCDLPSDFGDPQSEQGFAVNTVALIDKSYRCYFSFTGADRVRYLNAILTNNIKDLQPHQGNISLFLSPQGHILAEIETHAFDDRLFCISYSMIRERLAQSLEKYIIMDDVTLTDDSSLYATLALEGPAAVTAVRELTGTDISIASELSSFETEINGIYVGIVKRSPGGVTGAEFLVEQTKATALWQVLLELARKHNGRPMGYTALSAQRLAQGIPWFGYDFGEKQIPHEAGLENSHISYTKGCYTGQEIVERVRSRGQVNRNRVELLFSGETVPESGAQLTLEGKEVGFVTRAAKNFFPPSIIGMGYVRKEGNTLGTKLDTTTGTATVVHFPEALQPK